MFIDKLNLTIAKQPNNKYYLNRYDKDYNRYYKINLSEDEAIKYVSDLLLQKIKQIQESDVSHGSQIKYFIDAKLEECEYEKIGFNRPVSELKKYIPAKPLNQFYVACDFETVAKCPTCKESVRNGMGGKDEKCTHCGQILDWDAY